MNSKKYIEAISLMMLGLALWAVGWGVLPRAMRNRPGADGAVLKRITVVQNTSAVYGGTMLLLAGISVRRKRRGQASLASAALTVIRGVPHELRACRAWISPWLNRRDALWLSAILVLALTPRLYFLRQPMRYDEAYTYTCFGNGSWLWAFWYPVPNNHVLHTCLMRASVSLLGSSPWGIRLPALVAGLLAIPAFVLFARLLLKTNSGFITALLMATWPTLLLFDTMARGYSLISLGSAITAILMLRLLESPSPQICVLLGLAGALGLWVMPTFLLFLGGLYLWGIVIKRLRAGTLTWPAQQWFVWSLLLTLAFTLVLYTPVILISNGAQTLLHNKFVASLTWREYFQRLGGHIRETLQSFLRDVPLLVTLLAAFLISAALWCQARARRWEAALLLPLLLLGAFLILTLQHAIPFTRNWLYLIPFAFVMADAGMASLDGLMAPTGQRALAAAAMALSALWAIQLIRGNVIALYEDTGRAAEAPQIADFIAPQIRPGDTIDAPIPLDAPLQYYLQRRGKTYQPATSAPTGRCFHFYAKPSASGTLPIPIHGRSIGDFQTYEIVVEDPPK